MRVPHDPHSRAHSRGTRARRSSHGAHSCAPRAPLARSPLLRRVPAPRGSHAVAASLATSGSEPPLWGPLGRSSAAGTSVPSPSHWSDHPSGLRASATPGGHALDRWHIWHAHCFSARTCRFQHVCAVCSQMLHRENSRIHSPLMMRSIFTRRSGSPLNFAAPFCSRLAHAASQSRVAPTGPGGALALALPPPPPPAAALK